MCLPGRPQTSRHPPADPPPEATTVLRAERVSAPQERDISHSKQEAFATRAVPLLSSIAKPLSSGGQLEEEHVSKEGMGGKSPEAGGQPSQTSPEPCPRLGRKGLSGGLSDTVSPCHRRKRDGRGEGRDGCDKLREIVQKASPRLLGR